MIETTLYDKHILVYPNITFQKNLNKDSYVIVLRKVIEYLNTKKEKILWTIISPKFIEILDFDNTRQIIYEMPTYPNLMRCHFDVQKLKEILDWKSYDYDFIFSNLPEHTTQLANFFYNNTNNKPKIFGYLHWIETKESVTQAKYMFNHNISGLLEMDKCGLNSEWLKNYILKKASFVYNTTTFDKLESILEVCYLGIDNILKEENEKIPKSIIFNHRASGYTGSEKFFQNMDKLWLERQDFKVYTTMIDITKPYVEKLNLDSREDYFKMLSKMSIGVGTFKDYSAWSLSTTDGLGMKVPYLLPRKLCYPEMLGVDYPYFYDDDLQFFYKLNQMLDNQPQLNINLERFTWENRLKTWFNDFEILNDYGHTMSCTDSYKKMYNYIFENTIVTKKQLMKYMGWGVNINLTPYRNRLRKDGIKFTLDSYIYIDD
jgi:hypothetical protein